MEGVEDIQALHSRGHVVELGKLPEYLDALEEMPRTVDVATHVPHGAVRAYVMGDVARPTRIQRSQISPAWPTLSRKAWCQVGFQPRTVLWSIDGEFARTTATPENSSNSEVLARVGHGVFEMASDLIPEWNEFDWMGDLVARRVCPSPSCSHQSKQ